MTTATNPTNSPAVPAWMLQAIGAGGVSIGQIMKLSPESIDEIARVGAELYMQGRMGEARVIFQGLAAVDPASYFGHAGLAVIAMAQDNLDEARECLERAVKLDPKDPAPYANLGEVLLRQANAKDALPMFQKAMALDPQRTNPAANRARAMLQGLSLGLQMMSE
jgi:tetratricopeptide (TPR) repeat protein